MKISLICPIFNERKSVRALIKSMLDQSRKADEIIFVDGFSSDGTDEIIERYVKKNKGIRLMQKRSNIAEARNIAVGASRYGIIAATDASCRLNRDWLKNIVAPFEDKGVDVVSGGYVAVSEGGVEDYISMLTVSPMSKWNEESFLPSARSVAFRKAAWKKVGGYPENVYTGEDTLFGLRLKERGFKFRLEKKAVVYWRGRDNVWDFVRQFFLYGKGDGEAGNLKRMKKNLVFFVGMNFWLFGVFAGLVLMPVISLILIAPLILYLGFVGMSYALRERRAGCLFWIPILLFLKRFSYFFGAWRGMIG